MTVVRETESPVTVAVTGEPCGERAGSYRTIGGARRAVLHLVEQGIGRDAVALVPRGLRLRRTGPLATRLRLALQVGALTGALVGAGAGAAVALAAVGSLWMVLFSVPAGVAAGAVAGAVVAGSSGRGRSPVEWLEADRYEVVCTERPAHASHLLARWWDPEAPPASRRRAA
jgi:hypothetical protein